ncbi:MAG: DUF167 domain-containing protein [Paracoccaceae bacterium]
MDLSEFSDGRQFTVRVTPKASRNEVRADPDGPADLRVYVTVVPEGGKANAAVIKLLAKALRVPKSRLEILRGQSGRNKVFRVA